MGAAFCGVPCRELGAVDSSNHSRIACCEPASEGGEPEPEPRWRGGEKDRRCPSSGCASLRNEVSMREFEHWNTPEELNLHEETSRRGVWVCVTSLRNEVKIEYEQTRGIESSRRNELESLCVSNTLWFG